MTTMDTRALRRVLGCFATGVAVITTHTPVLGHVGVTVNSFASVSLDPPLVLFSLSRKAKILASFEEAKSFAINMLALGQEGLSNMFAKPSTALWEATRFVEGAEGCALLAGSLAQLECTKTAELDGGDHVILLGRVERFHLVEDAGDPLLFYRGRYGTCTLDRWSKQPATEATLYDFSVSGWG